MAVLHLYILKLLAGMREYDDGGGNLLPEFVQLLVSLLDLLVEGLVFDLELLEIDQMEAIRQLLLLFQDLLLIC